MPKSEGQIQFQEFFDRSPDLMCIAGHDGYFKKVNAAFTKILGYSEVELTTQPYVNFVDTSQVLATTVEAKNVSEGNNSVYFENTYIAKDGSRVVLSWQSVTVGSFIYATARDITQTKRLENELIEKKRRLRFVLENAPVSVFSTDKNGVITLAMGRVHSKLGIPQNHNVGKNIIELNQDRYPGVVAAVHQALKGEEASSAFTVNGLHLENRYSPVFDERGGVNGVIGVSVDVTDRKIAEDKLKKIHEENRQKLEAVKKSLTESEESFRYLTESLPQIVWTSNADGKVDFFNQRWFSYTGLSRAGGKNLDWHKALHPEDRVVAEEKLKVALEAQESYEFECRFRNAQDGTFRWHLGRAIPVKDENNRVVKWFGTYTDIDEHKRIQDDLKKSVAYLRQMTEEKARLIASERAAIEASKLKSQFLAHMSHEIRTPLNGVLGMAKLLSETHLSVEQNEFMQALEESGKVLLALINDVLDLSKIEAGKLEIEAVKFDALSTLKDVAKVFGHVAAQKNLELKMTPVDREFFVKGDPTRFRQIFFNIIQNAVKFTTQGSIRIHWSLHKGKSRTGLRVDVKDTGVGIAAESVPQIFKSFNQADSSTTRKYGGTGLGLSICKRLVQLMGGEISVVSEFGRGSKFTVLIPFEEVSKPQGEVIQLRRSEVRTSKGQARILVAEDNPINQKLIRSVLGKFGYECDIVENGLLALKALETKKYHLVLMDCHMPVMDGFEASDRIRASGDKAIRNIPVIALTADAQKGMRAKCLQHKMNDYIKKPINFDELKTAIVKALRSRPKKTVIRPRDRELANAVVDFKTLSQLEKINTKGQSDIVVDLIEDYLNRTPSRIAILQKALASEDFETLGSEAHSIKSVSGCLGALQCARICAAIERASQQKLKQECESLVSQLEAAHLTAQTEFFKVLASRKLKPKAS